MHRDVRDKEFVKRVERNFVTRALRAHLYWIVGSLFLGLGTVN